MEGERGMEKEGDGLREGRREEGRKGEERRDGRRREEEEEKEKGGGGEGKEGRRRRRRRRREGGSEGSRAIGMQVYQGRPTNRGLPLASVCNKNQS